MNIEKNLKRYRIVYIILVAFFTLCYFRVLYAQVIKGDERKAMAERQYQYIKNLDEHKYLLLDRNGKNLLDYSVKYYAVIDQFIFNMFNKEKDNKDLLLLKYTLREYNIEYKVPEITNMRTNNELIYEIGKETYDKLREIKGVKGFYTYTYTTVNRTDTWKVENLISNIKNTSDDSLKDSKSLEMQIYNRTKDNVAAKVVFQRGRDESIVNESNILPDSNVNVRLTLDKNIEDSIYEVLNRDTYSKYQQIGVTLMDSKSGKILAMTQKNNRLPNVNLGAGTENGFAPGSIFKTIVLETAFDMGKVSLAQTYDCVKRKDSLCQHKIHGTISTEDAFIKSCNYAFESIGNIVDYNNCIKMAKAQGLYDKVLNFNCEVKGDYEERDKKTGAGRGLVIGQNMRITPVQALAIANTVVNGGVYVKPYIIDSYVDENNKVIEQFSKEEKTVMKKTTANLVKNEMIKVVTRGTAIAAKINGIEVGGKTGTSQRNETSSSGIEETFSDGWFIGFFKVNNKYYTMVVFVKDIDVKDEEAGTTAVPVFKSVVENIKRYL